MLPFILILGVALATVAWLLAAPLLRRRRRLRWATRALPEHWGDWLRSRVSFYEGMPIALRERLHGLMQIFVREKSFVGCNGLVVTEEMRVVIAAHACMLVLNRPDVPQSHIYDELFSILVYPTRFIVRETDEDAGIVTEGHSVLSGQAWDSRRIILSWEDVCDSASENDNVVLHEFAHYLDMEDETMDGSPGLGSAAAYQEWASVFRGEYERLVEEVDAGRATFLDPYAASEPAEFFAVTTETFFHQPRELQSRHPGLYEQLMKYYRVDPAKWKGDG